MRVSVYLLRRKGERIPLENVRASSPRLGYVRVGRAPGGRVGHWSRSAILVPAEDSTEVLLQLHDVQLQLWNRRGLVISGTEIQWDRKHSERYRQSWFVVFSGPPSGGWAVDLPSSSLAPSERLVATAA
jgi:hypothetical protein